MTEKTHGRGFPVTVLTAYSDLVARLQEEAILALGGTPVLRERNGKKYWYVVQRLAEQTVEKYLGPDTEALRHHIQAAQQQKEHLKEIKKQTSRLASMSREGGLPSIDVETGKVLLAISKAGIFRLRGVLVGTHAFRCYPALLGVQIPEALAVTEDIDVAAFHSISVALDDHLDPALGEALREIGPFTARPSIYRQPTSWRDEMSGVVVELLTPNEGPDRDEPLELTALGAYAQPLRFLDYLIHEPVQAAALYRSGVLVNVPQPARYAVHKLIVAVRRVMGATEKARKDIEQAAALIRVLAEHRPDELEKAFSEAWERGPTWRESMENGLGRLPSDAHEKLIAVVGGPRTA